MFPRYLSSLPNLKLALLLSQEKFKTLFLNEPSPVPFVRAAYAIICFFVDELELDPPVANSWLLLNEFDDALHTLLGDYAPPNPALTELQPGKVRISGLSGHHFLAKLMSASFRSIPTTTW